MRPPALTPLFDKIFIGILIILFVMSFVSLILKNKKKGIYQEIFENIYSFFIVNTFLGAVFYFFNYERIPFLSSRFWFIIWAIEMIIWIVVIRKMASTIPEKKKKQKKHKEYRKYIP